MTRIYALLRLLLVLTISATFTVACTDSGGNLGNDRSGSPGPGGDNGGNGGDGEEPEVPEPLVKNQYQAANQCFALKADDNYIQQANGGYGVTSDEAAATAFYWKPTNLGTYLLLSSYARNEGEVGSKELLGITDQMGELLDELGNFIGEVGYLAGGVGDMTETYSDIVLLPAQGAAGAELPRARAPGDALVEGGNTLADQNIQPALGLVTQASDLAVWRLGDPSPNDEDYLFTLQSEVTGQYLSTTDGALALTTEPSNSSLYELIPAEGCDEYPEADIGAVVSDSGPANHMKDVAFFADEIETGNLTGDEIYGYVDAHAHISAYEFIGGRINYGDPFHKFGVDHALADCQENHGPQGLTGLVEAVTTDPEPHVTQGWPNFEYWPRRGSKQHHQSYYKWMERAWLNGQKILVNHLVHNEILCQLNPQKQNDCDAMPAILLQAEKMHDMQDYIDAQYGGPGEGWFQIVTSSAQAREVIANGKMAVILGVEMSKVLNCGEFQGVAQCTEAEIKDRLDQLQAPGVDVASIFPVHKFDNAFGGHLPDLGNPAGISGVLYAGNLHETGHPVEYETCPEAPYHGNETEQGGADYLAFPENPSPSQESFEKLGLIEQLLFSLDFLGKAFPESPEELAALDPRGPTDQHCNTRGLTPLGEFLVKELMARNMMIELDHISRKAAARVLEITQNAIGDGQHYPTVNSHGGWSHHNTRNRIAEQGGFSTPFGSDRSGLYNNLINYGNSYPDQYKVGPFGGVGMSSDVNGIASLAGNGGVDGDLPTTFNSLDGQVTFGLQKTGDKVFSLHEEGRKGVSHYGLYADQVADMIFWANRIIADPEDNRITQAGLKQALGNLYSSAEAYLRMWERAEAYQAPQ